MGGEESGGGERKKTLEFQEEEKEEDEEEEEEKEEGKHTSIDKCLFKPAISQFCHCGMAGSRSSIRSKMN